MRNFRIHVEKVVRWLFVLLLLYVLVSAAVLFFYRDYMSEVALVAPKLIVMYLLVIAVVLFLKTARWFLLLRTVNMSFSAIDAARIYIGGISMVLTPGRLGELWRAWILAAKFRTGYRSGIPLVVCDKLLDLNALLLFAALGLFAPSVYQLLALVCLAIFLPPMLLCFKPRWGVKLVKLAWALAGKRFPRHFAGALTMFRNVSLLTRPSIYFPAFSITMFAWLAEAMALSIMATGLGGELPMVVAAASLGLANIVGVMTFLPGGVGGQEAMMIYLLRESGNNLPIAVAVAGIVRICSVFIPALLGVPFFVQMSRRNPDPQV